MTETRHLFSTPFVIDRLQSAEGLAMLRAAIDAGYDEKLIQTVRGLGYRIGRNASAA